ncbi:MAG TPA: RNase adapter RapZ [Acetobacteraceae bacterium]|nr:RNase adapter RapZ [Acetobacteraceae bacterium]
MIGLGYAAEHGAGGRGAVSRKRVVLVSGLSGAGKSSILRALEDIGYEAVDNPPLTLIEDLIARGDERPLAVGVDTRTRGFDADEVLATLARLRVNPALQPELVFAWAEEVSLLRRYTETRRRHPLALTGRVVDGIAAEVRLTAPLRAVADLVLDTSGMPLPALRRTIEQRFGDADTRQLGLVLSLVSFAYPSGLPREADLVFDARFLRNPHYDPVLRPLTGLDAAVAAYVAADPDFPIYIDKITNMLTFLLPRFVQEGKKYVTVAVGCTGGCHRSVTIVETLAANLTSCRENSLGWRLTVAHLELQRDGIAQRRGSPSDGALAGLSQSAGVPPSVQAQEA